MLLLSLTEHWARWAHWSWSSTNFPRPGEWTLILNRYYP